RYECVPPMKRASQAPPPDVTSRMSLLVKFEYAPPAMTAQPKVRNQLGFGGGGGTVTGTASTGSTGVSGVADRSSICATAAPPPAAPAGPGPADGQARNVTARPFAGR